MNCGCGVDERNTVIETSLDILNLMFKARDKSRLQFKDWISRILQNLILFITSIQPKTFDDPLLNQDLNKELVFDFIFEREEEEEKMQIKHLKEQVSVGKSLVKL